MRKIVSLCLMLVMSMMIWADRTLYFVPNSNWTQANAKFAVYCFENEESEWSDFMTLVAGETNVYTTAIPDSYTQVIFCRMDGAATECNWGSKWNQSADIILPTDGKDMFTLADGWDQMSGTWSNYAAPQQQDTTNVSPLADKHFYLNGEFLNWDTQKALEFTLADSLFTLTVDTLSGTFKVMTARDWDALDYGGDYDVNLTLGVPYTLTERGYNLSCSTIYLNAELQLRLVGNDVILTLVSGTPVQQDTTGTNPQDTTQVEMITYYAVNTPRWSLPYAYVWDDVLGAYRTWPGEVMDQTGINFRGYEVYSYTMPKEYTMMIINNGKGGDNNQTPDMQLDTTLRYMYDLQWYASLDSIPAEQQDTTGTNPQDTTSVTPEVEHYYLIGAFNEWNVETALEFFNLDSFYTLKTASLEGEFKILTARSWDATNYGAANEGDQLVPGDEYELNSNSAPNLSVNGAYTNVILTLTKTNDILKLYFAAGTPVQQDTTGTNPQDTTIVPPVEEAHYYMVGQFNDWTVAEAPEFTLQDSIYTITIDTMAGDFKIVGARDWAHGDYGASAQGDVINFGEAYTLASSNSKNLSVNGTYTNATFKLAKNGVNLVLYFAAGTPVQQDTTGTNPQDTTIVPPVEEAHYYMVGSFNEWTVAEAPEFTLQDSIYTITIDTMAGEFKIVGARDWTHGDYGAAAQGDVINFGEAYTLVSSNSKNLSVNGTYTNATFKLAKNGVNLVLYFAAGTPVQQDTTGTNPQDTTIVPPVVDTHYYIKNNWNGGEWTWQTMTRWEQMNNIYEYTGVFGGTGVNINTTASDQDALWFAVESFQLADGSLVPQAMDTVLFIYNNEANTLTATVIGRPSVEPQPQEETHYYMVGQFNGWDVATAPEFAMQDSIYTITIDTMVGDFKIVGARDWAHGEYGAAAQGDVIDLGGTYTLATPGAPNLSVNGTYTNATFQLAKNGVNLVLYFAAGTPVQQDTTIVPPVVNDITVYTVMPEGWGALNAYIWIGNQGYVTWPGEAMTNTGETFRGDTVYSYTFPETYTSIIFNNGNGEQTIDLTIDTTKLYYYGETWYASWDEVPEEVIILPATYYVSGNENLVTAAGLSPDYAWNAAAIKATSDTLVLNLRANTDYKLRLTLNGTWVSDVKNYYYLTEVTPGLTTDLEANICFTPAEDGPVTIIYNDSVFTVQGNFIVFAKPTYYIKNNWEAGTDWTWQQMNAIDNDSIYWGYVGVFGGTGVDIATEVSDDAPSTWFDVSSFIVEEGDLIPQPLDTVYFVFDALRETLTAAVINRPGGVEPQPQPETHFYLVGQFNGWDLETAPEFALQDSFVYTMTVDTLFGAMKVVVSRDSWEGNYGVADMNDAVLTIGQTKALVPYLSGISDNFNFSVEGIILNAVLNIVVTDNVVNITLVSGTPYVTPAENRHFYMTGAFNDWNVETALEFVYADSVYTLTIDTIYGEFKVTDARDWLHGIYGAYNIGDVLNLGNEYAMAAMNSQNLNFSQTYTNVTLNIRVENNVVTIIFVSGTPVPTTGLDTTVGNTATPVKLIENGALIILRDGVKYNAAGQRIR